MVTLLWIVACCLLASVLVYTLVERYATLRRLKVSTFIIALIISLPALGISLFVLISGNYTGSADMWALGVCGILAGFWFKVPFRTLIES